MEKAVVKDADSRYVTASDFGSIRRNRSSLDGYGVLV
jgi:hypothetical protein